MPTCFLSPVFTLTAPDFSLADTLDCGQCFRFSPNADGSFSGLAGNHFVTIAQREGQLLFYDTIPEDLPFWQNYLDLNEDYAAYRKAFSQDDILRQACAYAGGIRLVRQDPWEALCSFIISQNNNIPRIKGIIDRLCAQFGPALPGGRYGFPSPEALAGRSTDDLAGLRAGFRAGYLLDAARRVADGQLVLSDLYSLPLQDARQALRQVKGVGPKVAECALLYGFHRLDAFPMDVWIKRALQLFYPDGFPAFAIPQGVAQQYLFHYIRTCPDAVPKELRHA